MDSDKNFSWHQFTIDGREFHEKRYQTHENEISHFAIEMLYLPSNHIGACVQNKKNINRLLYLQKKIDLIQIYGILKCAPSCLQSNALMCLILNQRQ